MANRRSPSTDSRPYLLYVELLREDLPMATGDGVSIMDTYPFCLPAVRHLDSLAFHPKVTFLVGENGAGKSTLMEALATACGLNPEGGSRNFNFATRASHSNLHEHLRVAKARRLPADRYFLRGETYYNLASEIDRLDQGGGGPPIIDSYGGISLHEQSHGESFFALFKHRFRGSGLYLMDEPESALSPQRQLEFLSLLHAYCRKGAQFIIATHSPILMAYPDAWIYVLCPDGIIRTPYVETEHYRITQGFLSNPEKLLAVLFEREKP